jgi:hypothetical protein
MCEPLREEPRYTRFVHRWKLSSTDRGFSATDVPSRREAAQRFIEHARVARPDDAVVCQVVLALMDNGKVRTGEMKKVEEEDR